MFFKMYCSYQVANILMHHSIMTLFFQLAMCVLIDKFSAFVLDADLHIYCTRLLAI